MNGLKHSPGADSDRPADGEAHAGDTIYSMGVFDVTAPLTITVPDAGSRFLSLMTVNQDHYIPLITYKPGDYTLTRENVGSRYVYAIFRIFGNPNDAADLAEVKKLQSRIRSKQADPGKLELPVYDEKSLQAVWGTVKQLAPYIPDSRRTFGKKADTDDVRHLTTTAFHYARVIEIPTPRLTAYDAVRFKVEMDKEVTTITQERAVTSPIWCTP